MLSNQQHYHTLNPTTTFSSRRYTLYVRRSPTSDANHLELLVVLNWAPFICEDEWTPVLHHIASLLEANKQFMISLPNIVRLVFQTHGLSTLERFFPGWTLCIRSNCFCFRWHIAGTMSIYLELDMCSAEETESAIPTFYGALIHIQPRSLDEPIQWVGVSDALSYGTPCRLRERIPPYDYVDWNPDNFCLNDSLQPQTACYEERLKRANIHFFEEMKEQDAQYYEKVAFSDVISDRIYYLTEPHRSICTSIHVKGTAVIGADAVLM